MLLYLFLCHHSFWIAIQAVQVSVCLFHFITFYFFMVRSVSHSPGWRTIVCLLPTTSCCWIVFVQHTVNRVAKQQRGTYWRYCHVFKPAYSEKRALDTFLITLVVLQMGIYGHADCRSQNPFHKMNISSISLLKCCSCYTSQLSFLCYVRC